MGQTAVQASHACRAALANSGHVIGIIRLTELNRSIGWHAKARCHKDIGLWRWSDADFVAGLKQQMIGSVAETV